MMSRYRAIYVETQQSGIKVISIEEISKHEY